MAGVAAVSVGYRRVASHRPQPGGNVSCVDVFFFHCKSCLTRGLFTKLRKLIKKMINFRQGPIKFWGKAKTDLKEYI